MVGKWPVVILRGRSELLVGDQPAPMCQGRSPPLIERWSAHAPRGTLPNRVRARAADDYEPCSHPEVMASGLALGAGRRLVREQVCPFEIGMLFVSTSGA
jgi:hypothetical protein